MAGYVADRAAARERMLAERAAQGLPPRVEDPEALGILGRIFASVEPAEVAS